MTTKAPPKKLVIKEDVTDWLQEFYINEPDISKEDDLIELRQSNCHPNQVGRFAIVARELGLAPEALLPANKMMLNAGATQHISQMMSAQTRIATLENGTEIEVRAFVGSVSQDADEGEENKEGDDPDEPKRDWSYVKSSDPASVDRAVKYVLTHVVGHIRPRLLTIAEHSREDVKTVAEQLKRDIDAMVTEFS